jgi:hypothetical protein
MSTRIRGNNGTSPTIWTLQDRPSFSSEPSRVLTLLQRPPPNLGRELRTGSRDPRNSSASRRL